MVVNLDRQHYLKRGPGWRASLFSRSREKFQTRPIEQRQDRQSDWPRHNRPPEKCAGADTNRIITGHRWAIRSHRANTNFDVQSRTLLARRRPRFGEDVDDQHAGTDTQPLILANPVYT